MAWLAIGAIGAWLAPAGYAALGWAIGSSIGQALFSSRPPDVSQEGPRLADLSVQTSTDGTPILHVHGTARIAGNIIWSAGIKETKSQSSEEVGGKGGKGGQTVTTTSYSYSCSFALSLCKGPIIGVRKIWADGKIIYSAVATDDPDVIAASSALLDHMTSYLGTASQMPDPVMESHEGAGNVPAYRGQAYIVFNSLPLANFGNRIPNFTVEVVEAGAVAGPYKVLSKLPTAVAFANNNTSSPTPVILGIDAGVVRIGVLDSTVVHLFDLYGNYLGTDARQGNETLWVARADAPVGTLLGCSVTYREVNFSSPISGGDLLRVSRISTFITSKIADLTDPLPDAEYFGGVALCADGRHAMVFTSPSNAMSGGGTVNKWYLVAFSGESVSLIDSGTIAVPVSIYEFLMGAASINHFGVSHMESSLRHVWAGYGAGSKHVRLYEVGNDKILRKIYDYTGLAGIFSRPSIHADNGVCVVISYNEFAVFTRMPSATPAAKSLPSVVTSIAQSAGLQSGDINTAALTGTLDGYVLTQPMSARAALEPLMRAHFFDAIESGKQIKFIPRGGASAATIAEADLAAHGDSEAPPDTISIERDQELELPRAVTVLYMDPAADYQQGSQRSTRLITAGRGEITIEMPMVLSANRARQIADVLLTDAWMSRKRMPLALPPKYIDLEPTDVITVQGTSATHTVRIIDQEIGANGVIRAQAVAESASAYTSTAVGAPPAIPAQALSLVGPTALHMLDIPILRDLDDTPGCYLAAAGYLSGWKGAVIEQSRDAGESWSPIATKLSGAPMGFATTTLAAPADTRLWDHAGSLNVRILSGGTLSSSTEDGVIAGANLALLGVHGRWELLHFRDATLEANGTWTLRSFLRGCFGTEYSTDKHAVNDAFVLVTSTSLLHLKQAIGDLNLALKYHALSIGAPAYTPATVDFTNSGLALRAYPVNNLAGIKQANGDWLIQWTPRVRKGQSWMTIASIAADPVISGYQVDIMSGSAVKRSVYVTGATMFAYPAGGQQQDFTAVQSTLKVRVYAYNAQVGLGYGVEITAPSNVESYLAPVAFTAVPYAVPAIAPTDPAQEPVADPFRVRRMSYYDGGNFYGLGSTDKNAAARLVIGNSNATTWEVRSPLDVGISRAAKSSSLHAIMINVWFGYSSTGLDGSWTYVQRENHPLRQVGGGYYYDMTSDGTRFVACGDRGILESTTDFVTWTEHAVGQIGLGAALYVVRYGNGVYLVHGTDGGVRKLWRSADRVTWTDVTPVGFADHTIVEMVYAAGKWVMVGQRSNQYLQSLPAIWLSADNGLTWALQVDGGVAGQSAGCIAHNGTVFAVTGFRYRATSSDGVTWAAAYDEGVARQNKMVANGSLIVAADSARGVLRKTTDGVTWTDIQ